jgi:hypothetical protein
MDHYGWKYKKVYQEFVVFYSSISSKFKESKDVWNKFMSPPPNVW